MGGTEARVVPVDAVGVEREIGATSGANAFNRWQLPPLADFTDVLEKHPKSTRFLEGYWRRRDDAPAAAEQHDRRSPTITFVVRPGLVGLLRHRSRAGASTQLQGHRR